MNNINPDNLEPVDFNDSEWKIALVNNILTSFDNVGEALLLFKHCYECNELYHFNSNKACYAILVSLLTPEFIRDLFALKQSTI